VKFVPADPVWRRRLLAVASGLLLVAAFPLVAWGWTAPFALVPLLVALRTPGSPREATVSFRQAFRLGYLTGAVFFLGLLYWIPMLPRENITIPYGMVPALFLMVAYLALFPALSAATAAWLARRRVPLAVGFPLAWTLLEAARSSGTFGFPWGAIAYALAPFPHLIQFAAFTGMWGVTLWLVLLNGLIHAYASSRWTAPKATLVVVTFLVFTVPVVYGRHEVSHREPRGAVRVGLVQPNVGNDKWRIAVRDSIVIALLNQTDALAREWERHPPELLVWPETALPARLPHEPYYRFKVEDLVNANRVPLLAGFPDGEPLPQGGFRFTNSAALFIPQVGMVGRYDKRQLVPFSEFFPLPLLNRFDFGQSDFSPGDHPGLFTQLDEPFGLTICFESIFPGPARMLGKLGARYLVNITNDQWFGNSAAPEQHWAMNVMRAVENHMGLVRAANTGISGVIDPYGFVRARTLTFVEESLVVPVELGNGPTFYARHGDWVLAVTGVLFGAAVVGAVIVGWKAR